MGFLTDRHASGWDFFFGLSPRGKAIAVGVLVLPVLVWVVMMVRHRAAGTNEMQAAMLEACVPEHGEAACAEWLDANHEACFARTYSSSGRTQTTVVDQAGYNDCVQFGVEALLEQQREAREARFR